ncbi:MAG: condensation domain-containing protein, partial [Pyrinomonadaceae bacterium]
GPRNEMEALVAGVWQQVLGLERVGIHDNFFDLGGHSLLATQVVTRLRDTLKVQIPLMLIFENSTVAGLTAALEAEVRAGMGVIVPPVAHVPHDGAVPLSFAQQRLWFLDRLMPDAFSYNTPLAYRITGPLNVEALEKSISQIVARHEVLRTTIALVEGEPVQTIAPEVRVKLEVSDLELVPGSECEEVVQREVEREAQLPFDLSTGPVIRARLLRIAPDDYLLVVTLHHIVADGWSIGVFAGDLSAFYGAAIKGREAALPQLPVQYADYAAWQREWLKGEELERQLRYWREQLQGAPTVLELPGDKPRPKVASGHGALERFEVGGAVLAGLKSIARQEGATLFMTLLAAFAALLSRYSGQKDLLIGAPIANRNREELEGLIGFFANTLVLRTRIDDDVTFRGLVQRAREACLGAYAHQDVPFEALVDELQPERDLSRSPLFQVVLTVQNAPMRPLELSGLTLSSTKVHTDTAKFDLGLNIYEKDSSLAASFEYNRDILEPETIWGLIERFQLMLAGIVGE